MKSPTAMKLHGMKMKSPPQSMKTMRRAMAEKVKATQELEENAVESLKLTDIVELAKAETEVAKGVEETVILTKHV